MVVKKRKLATEAGGSDERPKYLPGKHPKNQEKTPHVDYNAPLNPKSELFLDDWHIPKFNRFISFTLDVLIDKYKDIFKDFIKLPSRKFHPQYYYKIQQPMSINEIKSRDYEYEDGPSNFLLDVELLTKNCQAYNEYDSLIVKNSMQVVMLIEFEVLKAKNLKRNYLINSEVKAKLLHYLNKLVDATEKKINQALLGASSPKNLDDKVKLSEPFMELVDKDELPEYYEIVHSPMALSIVKQNLEIGQCSKIYDFIIDMLLVFQNAHIFNDPSALIYKDATTLTNYFNYLIQKEFFPELQDLNERGEINLEFDKFEFENYLAIGGGGPAAAGALAISALDNDIEPESNREDLIDQADYDFNHFEGLGNGYNRSLLTEDYLLNPNNFKKLIAKPETAQSEVKNERSTTSDIEKTNSLESEHLKIPKYNVIKSMQKEMQSLSEQHTMEYKPYKLIQQIYIFSSKNLYSQATKPLPGSRPSCNQNWVEYIFNGNELSQNENAFSFMLQPMQTFLTLQSHLTSSLKDTETLLTINKEPVKSRTSNVNSNLSQPQQQENDVIGNDTKQDIENLTIGGGNNNDIVGNDNDKRNNITEIFDIRLSEGLNHLVFRCEDKISHETEFMNFWINVLP
ncbi:Chromatin structure-remodeling complex subunit rsc4 [Saccharomyces cerevisiae]|nr:ALH_1c_G0033600.mRNA.1.CDS.1 [Saccharomyces cerevisiae]CAI4618648.1 ALH_1b_G0033750.mRNA.1.CDS.1 [Saccharomyces cerevisiae]CAI6776673.1 ALH_1c_G0033600.mRNA.1.CDS.1 [Saccharomyces cerevisiae]CAI6777895.1 ALH_1b_G0033750.mRNA.1.CDS.1 [Saccharomyces cerevisiae]CAI6783867.1 AKR_collapsed_G0033970.mRNA.1.CDS.1 [Saccharomyces cerevisiae]